MSDSEIDSAAEDATPDSPGASAEPREPPDSLEQPANSRAAIERRGDGLTLRLPPIGAWKASGGLMIFSLIWLGFTSLFVAVAVMTLFSGPLLDGLIPLAFISLFVAVGLGLMLLAINIGRRQAIFDAVGDTLLVTHANLFGKQQYQWTAAQLKAIHVGPSGMKTNNIDILELQIVPVEGDKIGFLAGYDEPDLRWTAAVLRDALAL